MSADFLAWILTDLEPGESALLRRGIAALRLLRHDARASARRVGASLGRARIELEGLERARGVRALRSLLHAFVAAQRGPDSFLVLEPATVPYGEAWRMLPDPEWERRVPRPGEPPRLVITRLLEAAVGLDEDERAWWEAAASHVVSPAPRAERCWSRLLRRARATGAERAVAARLLRGLIAARLERFQPARAWATGGPRGAGRESARDLDPLLRRTLGWSALLADRPGVARLLLEGNEGDWLPRPLAELREDRPAWGSLLRGETGEPPEPGSAPGSGAHADRRVLGGLLLAVFVRHAGGAIEPLVLDAPAQVRRAIRRVTECPRTLEREADGILVRVRVPDSGWGAAEPPLAGASVRSLVRGVVRDEHGRLAGWVQLESSHWLLPSAPTLKAWMGAWRPVLLAARERGLTGRRPSHRERCSTSGAFAARAFPALDPTDPRVALARRLVEEVRVPPGIRAAWVERDAEGRFRVLAERGRPRSGTALDGAVEALRRACRAGRSEPFSPGPAASRRGGLGGWVVPLGGSGGCSGALLLESYRSTGAEPSGAQFPRTGALLRSHVREAEELVQKRRAAWWSAAFRAEMRARGPGDVAWNPSRRFPLRLERRLPALSAARVPLLVSGAPGSGRRTLARWLAFRLGVPCAGLELAPGVDPGEASALVHDGGGTTRVVLLPTLVRELRVGTESVPVPPLCARRDEIPEIALVCLEAAARGLGLAPVHLEDEALALLWRQPWPGHVAELRGLLVALARSCAGRRLGVEAVAAALRARGVEPCERLVPRSTSRRDVALAIATTRHANGSPNHARAARYLGWDRRTLAVRLSLARRGGPGARESGGASRVPDRRLRIPSLRVPFRSEDSDGTCP